MIVETERWSGNRRRVQWTPGQQAVSRTSPPAVSRLRVILPAILLLLAYGSGGFRHLHLLSHHGCDGHGVDSASRLAAAIGSPRGLEEAAGEGRCRAGCRHGGEAASHGVTPQSAVGDVFVATTSSGGPVEDRRGADHPHDSDNQGGGGDGSGDGCGICEMLAVSVSVVMPSPWVLIIGRSPMTLDVAPPNAGPIAVHLDGLGARGPPRAFRG